KPETRKHKPKGGDRRDQGDVSRAAFPKTIILDHIEDALDGLMGFVVAPLDIAIELQRGGLGLDEQRIPCEIGRDPQNANWILGVVDEAIDQDEIGGGKGCGCELPNIPLDERDVGELLQHRHSPCGVDAVAANIDSAYRACPARQLETEKA